VNKMECDVCNSIFYNSPTGYAYHQVIMDQGDKVIDYKILEVNPTFERLTGLKAGELVGKPITQVLPEIRKGSVDWVEYYGDLALYGGHREFTHYWEPLDVWLRVKAFSFQKGYFVIYLSNISREVQQIRELNTIFKLSPDGICVLDRDGNIIKANKALGKLLGCTENRLTGKNFLYFTHEEDREFTQEILAALVVQGSEANFVNRFRSYDGSYRYIDWRCLTHDDHIYVAARDITDRMDEQRVTDRLIQCSEEFLQTTAGDLDYKKIVEYLMDISGAGYASFRLLDSESKQFKTVASAGETTGNPLFCKARGVYEPEKDRRDNDDRRSILTIYPSLCEMTRSTVSEVALETLDQNLASGEVVVAKLIVDGNIIGDFTLIMPPGKPFLHKGPVEIFTRQVGLLLARIQAEKEVLNQKAYFEALFLNTTDAMLYFDEEANIYKINDQFTQLFGYELEEIKGAKVHSIFPIPISAQILAGERIFLETVRRTKSGKEIPVHLKGGPVYIEGQIKGGYAVYTDISERKAYEEHLKHLSLHDQLTGLYNRNFFETELKVIEKKKRYPITLIAFDIDGLKLVNDTLGHEQGDRLLQLAAQIISNSLRGSDFLARIGGDEFVAILPETDEETAKKIVKRIRENIVKANQEKRPFLVSISIGTATAFNHEMPLQEVMKKADERMYHEKLIERKTTQSEMLSFLFSAMEELKRLS
jgi:diguanylate cyclase (GGDEF)-like protein/PAS domain S-box-containing protein